MLKNTNINTATQLVESAVRLIFLGRIVGIFPESTVTILPLVPTYPTNDAEEWVGNGTTSEATRGVDLPPARTEATPPQSCPSLVAGSAHTEEPQRARRLAAC